MEKSTGSISVHGKLAASVLLKLFINGIKQDETGKSSGSISLHGKLAASVLFKLFINGIKQLEDEIRMSSGSIACMGN